MPGMPFPSAAPRLVLTVLLAISLAACGGEDPVPAGERPVLVEPDNPSVASAVADPTAPRLLSVVVTDGQLTGDTGVVDVRRNAPVRLSVITDDADTLVVQGYDLRTVVTAGLPEQLTFIADEAGEFPVVLEESGIELLRLRVS